MQKDTRENLYLAMSGLFLFLTLASVVVALCLANFIPAVCAAAFWIVFVTVSGVAAKKCEVGKGYFALSWAVVAVSVILIALLPVALIMWIVETIVEKARKAE